ncbi:MAG: methyltransferase [Terriglobia bacterium]
MRIGVLPEGVRDRLILRSPRFPLPVFDVMGTMLLSRAVMAGVHFGVFDRLATGAKTAVELAKEAGANNHGMELLLDALVACGYLTENNGRYCNAPLAARWLLSSTAPTLANFVRYNYDQWEWVSHLEEYIQRGAAQDIHEKLDQPQMWQNYMLGLRDFASLSADELVAALPVKSPRRLLDVGGGHAYHSIAMCRRHPTLRVVVVDLEPATRIGRELVAQAGLSERIEFRAGHLAETPLGDDHDLAFLFNVIHHLDEATCRATLRRLHTSLAPGGTLVVSEPFRMEAGKKHKDQLGSLLALFFGITSAQQTYAFSQVADWIREAGFRGAQRKKLRTAPYSALLLATK